MRFRLTTLFVTIMSLCIVDANPIASSVGAKHSAFVEVGEEPTVPYVQDGLVFIAEGFETPDVTWNMEIGAEVPTTEWTMEWCGFHYGNKRSNCFMGVKSKREVTSNPYNFTIGWWVNNDGIHINQRVYYGEVNSGQAVSGVIQLAYTVNEGSVMDMYADGIHYGQNSSLVATAITGQIGDAIRYIGGGAGDKLTVYSVRIYNRALTAEEIAYNAEIDRERFGE